MLKPQTTLRKLVDSPIVDQLNGAELLVYLRLIAEGSAPGKPIEMLNGHLHRNLRTAQKVLRRLERAKLVRVRYPRTTRLRTIEVLA